MCHLQHVGVLFAQFSLSACDKLFYFKEVGLDHARLLAHILGVLALVRAWSCFLAAL